MIQFDSCRDDLEWKTPQKMDDLGGKPTIFGNIYIYHQLGMVYLPTFTNNFHQKNQPKWWFGGALGLKWVGSRLVGEASIETSECGGASWGDIFEVSSASEDIYIYV